MLFVAPFFLIGLGALLVPIIIHLWSKDAKQSVSFGSLRFVKETETRTTRSIMPSQWLLLILRLFLLTLLVFSLAGMQYAENEERASRLYLIDPIYEGSELVKNLLDTASEGVEVRWLSTNFPLIEEPVSRVQNYWKLLSNLPTNKANCLVVFSPLHQEAFLGERRDISSVCEWIKPPEEVNVEKLQVIAKNDTDYTLETLYDEWTTTYTLKEEDRDGEAVEIAYCLKADDHYKEQEEIFQAAIDAVQEVSMVTLKKVTTISEADWLVWLSDEAVPMDQQVIVIDDQVFGWNQVGEKLVKVNDQLTYEDAIQMELPRKLLDVFVGEYFSNQTQHLLTVDQNLFQYKSSDEEQCETMQDASSYLWMLLLLFLLVERWLSHTSNKVSV